MTKALDLINQHFGRLKVIKYLYSNKNKKRVYLCECDCGNIVEVIGALLLNKHTNSCGCLRKEGTHVTHNMNNTRLYRIWGDMKSRCSNPNTSFYEIYGGKGILVCEEWTNNENGFINFYNWAINNGYTDKLSIDRIEGDSNYEPCNCRWVNGTVQNINKGIQKNNKSGTKGVCWDSVSNKWKTYIGINNEKIVLGYFSDINDAIAVRQAAELKYHKPLLDIDNHQNNIVLD